MRYVFFIFSSFLLLSVSAIAIASPAESLQLDIKPQHPQVRYISNVVYAQVPTRGYENVALQMDILKPERDSHRLPAILFITGGGFLNANKDSSMQQRMALADAGFVVASINYRVAPTAIFPQPLEDVKAAVRFLRANAARFYINPDKIGVLGESAGGYLAAMAGTTSGTTQFDHGEHLNQSSSVQAVVDLYGLSDLTQVGAGFSEKVQQNHRSSGAPEALWVNGSAVFGGEDGGIGANQQKASAANPISYISSSTPPFLLMHGDNDTIVSPQQTLLLHQALIDKGCNSTRFIVHGAQHGGIYWIQPEVTQLLINFFSKHLQ